MTRRARLAVIAVAILAIAAGVAGMRSRPPEPAQPLADPARLPPGAVARIGSTIFGPVGGCNTELLALSPDGTRLFTCDDEGVLRAWDVDRAAPLWSIEPHPDWTPAGVRTLRDHLNALEGEFRGWRETPRDLEASPDGRYLATCAGAMVRAFDAANGRFAGEMATRSAPQQLVWTADGNSVAWCEEGRVVVWDVGATAMRRSDVVSTGWFLLGRHPDGSLLAATMEEGKRSRLVAFDPATLAQSAVQPERPDGWGATFVFDRSGRMLLHRVEFQPFRESWGWLGRSPGDEIEPFVPGGPGAPTRPGHSILVWMPQAGRSTTTPSLHAADAATLDGDSGRLLLHGEVRGVAFSADGRRAAVARFGHARIFDAPTGRFLRSPDEVVSPRVFAPLPDGLNVLVVSCDERLLECDVETGAVRRVFHLPSGPGAQANAEVGLRVSADGRQAAGYGFRIDLVTGEVAALDDGPLPNGFGFRGEDVLRVWAAGDGSACEWGVSAFGRRAVPSGSETVRDPADGGAPGAGTGVLPQGPRRDRPAAVPLEGLTGVESIDGGFRFHADGTTVFGHVNGVVREWDALTGKELPPERRRSRAATASPAQAPGHAGAAGRGPDAPAAPRPDADSGYARFPWQRSEDGKVVAIEDRLLGETYVRLAEPVPFDGDVAAVDDTLAALGRHSGEILIFRRADGVRIGRIAGESAVVALAFVPGGRRLLAGHADGSIVVWDLHAALGRPAHR